MSDSITRATFGRKALAALFAGLGLLALHVADAKTGPDEFFSPWTSWRIGQANPLLTLLGAAGFILAFLAPLAVAAAALPPADRRGFRASAGRLLATLLMPLGWGMMITLQSSPPWFNAVTAAVLLPVSLPLWFGIRRPSPSAT